MVDEVPVVDADASAPRGCENCDDERANVFGMCPSCWAAAKLGWTCGASIAAIVASLIALVLHH